jgi:hypothetical protein
VIKDQCFAEIGLVRQLIVSLYRDRVIVIVSLAAISSIYIHLKLSATEASGEDERAFA